MNKIEQLQSDIAKIEKGLNSTETDERFKIPLREIVKGKKEELESLMKAEKQEPKKQELKKQEVKKVEPVKKQETEKKSGVKTSKQILDDCREILSRHNKEKKSAVQRIKERKKQGKPATLTPSETVSKTAKIVKSKVVDMKGVKDNGLPVSEVNKLSSGIVSTVKSTLSGIKNNVEKQKFLNNLISEIKSLGSNLTKVAMQGGLFEDGGMFEQGGRYNTGRSWTLDHNQHNKAEQYEVSKGDRKYEGGGGIDLLADMSGAELQNVGGTSFSNVDLTSHMDITHPMFEDGGMMAKGGGVSSVQMSKFYTNIMGTLSFDMKLANMRKEQDFSVYPISKGDTQIMIQSDTRIGLIDMASGKGKMSQSHPNGAYGVHLQMDNLVPFQLESNQLAELKFALSQTAGKNVGRSVVLSDNEGAGDFLERGGRYNTGRSWTLDHNQHNKAEQYEVSKGDRKFGAGGMNMEEYLEKKKYNYEEGGDIADSNTEMLMSKIRELQHHTSEIQKLVDTNTKVEAWVVAKAERSATDLSDITHYIDGKKSMEGANEKFAHGGTLGSVEVIFDNPKYNYTTSIGANVTEDEARKYFVGKMFDMGVYPTENFQKCIDIKFHTKDSYANGGGIDNIDELVGKYINVFSLGVKEPYTAQIVSATLDPKKFRKRFLNIETLGGGVEQVPLNLIDQFYNLNQIELKDSKGEPYMIELSKSGRMAKGGLTEHGLQIGDKIIDRTSFDENSISVMNDGRYAMVDLDKGERIEGIYADGGSVNKYFLRWDSINSRGGVNRNNKELSELPNNIVVNQSNYVFIKKDTINGKDYVPVRIIGGFKGVQLSEQEIKDKKIKRIETMEFADGGTLNYVTNNGINFNIIYNGKTAIVIAKIEDEDNYMLDKSDLREMSESARTKGIDRVELHTNYGLELKSNENPKIVGFDLIKKKSYAHGGEINYKKIKRIGEDEKYGFKYIVREQGDNYVIVEDEKIEQWEKASPMDRKMYYEDLLPKEEVDNEFQYLENGGETDDDMGVQFIDYKDKMIMYEPHYKEYYTNDIQFDSLEKAKKYIDEGSKMTSAQINAYRMGAMAKGGIIELKGILKQDYEKFVELLGENIKDKKFRNTVKELAKENKVKYKTINVPCEKLQPTQSEISLAKSLLFPLTSPYYADLYLKAKSPIRIENNTILTCDNGRYIIDGHHRWSQVFVLNPKALMGCTDFYQLNKPIEGLKATQLGIATDLGYVPTQMINDTNMLTVSENTLKKYVTDNITKEVREVFSNNGIENPEEHIWKNVRLLKTKNKPIKGASKRDFMPQTNVAKNFAKYTPNISKLDDGGVVASDGKSINVGDLVTVSSKRNKQYRVKEINDKENVKVVYHDGSEYVTTTSDLKKFVFASSKMAKGGITTKVQHYQVVAIYPNKYEVVFHSKDKNEAKEYKTKNTNRLKESGATKVIINIGRYEDKMAKGGTTTLKNKAKLIAQKILIKKKS